MSTKKLSDLYNVGEVVTIGDENDSVDVYIRKLNTVDAQTAVKRAAAKRARALITAKHQDSDDFLSFVSQAQDLGRDGMIELIIAADAQAIASRLEAQYADDKEWSEDGYLEGLRDAWEEVKDDYHEAEEGSPEKEEADRVFAELKRFQVKVEAAILREIEDIKDAYSSTPDMDLAFKAAEKLVIAQADQEWLTEFQRCQLWLGVRDSKQHNRKYFANRGEVDELAPEVIGQLVRHFNRITVDPTEGKESEEALTS